MNIVVINPTYNERENIQIISEAFLTLKQKIEEKGDIFMQLVVDDNSPDGTADVVKQMQKDYSFIHLIKGKKQGLGEAYIRGMKYAIKELKADIVIMMDADLQHDPNILPSMIGKLNDGYDFVIGSRYIKGGSYPEEWGRFRVFNSKIANILAIYIAGIYDIKDCTSGYRAIRVKNILDTIELNKIKAIGYSFQLMLLFELLKQHPRVIEYPITFAERQYGVSKIGFNKTYVRDILEFFKNAFRIRAYRIVHGQV